MSKALKKDSVVLHPAVNGLHGRPTMPGDKSISHRALMLGSLTEGISEITGLSECDDVASTARCMIQMGVTITSTPEITIVNGKGLQGLRAPDERLYVGNSGTTIRLMSGILAGQDFDSEITGDASIRKRPMRRIIEPLQKMNARIYGQHGNYAPLKIKGRPLYGVDHNLAIASAQVKSCLLIAGLYASGQTSVMEPAKSRDHTERMLLAMGAPLESENQHITVRQAKRLEGINISVPRDISSAAFFLVASSIVPDSEIVMKQIGINPTRTGIIDILRQMGGDIHVENEITENNEPRADLIVRSAPLHGVTIEGEMIPRIIDEIPVIAIAATVAEGRTEIRNAGELRVKESDRLQAVADNLKRMGVEVEEHPDGLIIEGPQQLKGTTIESFGDHRIAMAFAVAALMADGPTTILNAGTANVSHPGYYYQLMSLVE